MRSSCERLLFIFVGFFLAFTNVPASSQEVDELVGRNVDEFVSRDGLEVKSDERNEWHIGRMLFRSSKEPIGTILKSTKRNPDDDTVEVIVSGGIEVPDLSGKTVNGAIAELILNDLDYEPIIDPDCAVQERRVVAQHPPAGVIIDASSTKVIFLTQRAVAIPAIPVAPSKSPISVEQTLISSGFTTTQKLNINQPVYGACAYATGSRTVYAGTEPSGGNKICLGGTVTVLFNRYPTGIVNEAICDGFGNCICP